MTSEHVDTALENLIVGGEWQCDEEEIVLSTLFQGEHTAHEVHLKKNYSGEILFFSCATGVNMNPKRVGELLIFLNRLNNGNLVGHFVWDERDNHLYYLYEWIVPHSVGHEILEQKIVEIATSSALTCETHYPIFQAVQWGDLSPDNAALLIDSEVAGTA